MRLLTLFLPAENVHLTKDVGMVPFILHKHYGYDATLACYNNGKYPYLENEVKGLKIKFVRRIFNQPELDGLLFLLWNFRKYDMLMGFHLIRPTTIWLFFFQLLKGKRGISYLKLDTNDRFDLDTVRNRRSYKWYTYVMSGIKLVSAETGKIQRLLQNEWKRKIEYIPNGFYDWGRESAVGYGEKENIIITVGRIGSFEKAHPVLCEAFAQFHQKNRNWKLILIGPVLPEFEHYLEELYEQHSDMKDVILLTGNIASKEELYAWYRKAKIFAFTSMYEGFPLVFPEAIRFGCFVVSTNIGSAYDITDDEKYGRIFQVGDKDALAAILDELANNEKRMEDVCLPVQEYAREHFSWPLIAERLHKAVKSVPDA